MKAIDVLFAPARAIRSSFHIPTIRSHHIKINEEIGEHVFVNAGLVLLFFLIPLLHLFERFGTNKYFEAFTGALITLLALIAFRVVTSERAGPDEAEKLAISDLGPQLLTFITRQGHLELDFVAYTSETLEKALDLIRNHVGSGGARLASLRVRLLVWDSHRGVLPYAFDDDQTYSREKEPDLYYRWRTCEKITSHVNKAKEVVEQIGVKCGISAEDCACEVKYSPFEPSFKVAIINNAVAYFTIYDIKPLPRAFARQTRMNWDHEGRDLLLQKIGTDSALFLSLRKWFDAVWGHFALIDSADVGEPRAKDLASAAGE
jgi:hypothetical protein